MTRYTSFGKVFQFQLGLVLLVSVTALTWHFLRVDADADADTAALVSVNLVPGQPPARSEAYKLIDGPYEVEEVPNLILRDTQRGKDLPVRVEYPRGDGPFPVIIFSHGAGGSKDCCTDLTRHWASYGYVTLQPSHADSFKVGQEETPKQLADLRVWLGDAKNWENRVRDITFLLDSFAEFEHRVPALRGRLDAKRIGVGGHSFGAFTAQLIGGATVDTPETKAKSFADERVRAVMLLSGQGREQQGLSQHSWDALTRPMMTMTGSHDLGAGGQGPDWKKEPFDFAPPGDKFHVLIEGAGHLSFIGRLRPALSDEARPRFRAMKRVGAGREAIFSYVQISTLAFWDAYLKSDAKARAYLASDALESYSEGAAKLYRK